MLCIYDYVFDVVFDVCIAIMCTQDWCKQNVTGQAIC